MLGGGPVAAAAAAAGSFPDVPAAWPEPCVVKANAVFLV